MKLRITIDISDNQLRKMREAGNVSIRVPIDKILQVQNGEAWPMAFRCEEARYIVKIAKESGLNPSDLQNLSDLRVIELLNHAIGVDFPRDCNEYTVARVEEHLGIKFVHKLEDGEPELAGLFGEKIIERLNSIGVMTMTDLKTIQSDRFIRYELHKKDLKSEWNTRLSELGIELKRCESELSFVFGDRIAGIFRMRGITTMAALGKLSKNEIKNTPRIGKGSYLEIVSKLEELGIELQ